MTDPTEPSQRDELVKAIADGRSCGGHYNCGAMADDIAEAERDLDAYRAYVLRNAAQFLRGVVSRSRRDGYQGAADAEQGCADLLQAEADRLTEGHVDGQLHTYLSTSCHHRQHAYCQSDTGAAGAKIPGQCKFCAAPCTCRCHTQQPAAPCGDVRPLGLLGQPLGPCILTGKHTEHQDLNGTRWAQLPATNPYEQMSAAWQAIVGQVTRAMEAGTASVRASLTDPDEEQR